MAPLNSIFLSALAALAVERVAGHATFQDLWINGVDYGAQCARLPTSNSPVTDVTSNNIRCNANSGPVAKKCAVKGGDTVTIEIHQQPGDRNCASEAIGGAHYGPVQAYLSSVSNSATADGSAGFFKIYADTWAHNTAGASGDDDFWGTKDINTCCGKLNVKIPTDIAPGDYLLRAEALALHTAGSSGGAQFYLTCYQLTIASSGTAKPATVTFPGAYKASDPGILVNIHAKMASYTAPGPAVYAGGSTKVAGSACSGCEKSCTPGGAVGSASSVPQPTSSAGASTPSGGSSSSAGSVAAYGQCGGTGWTGATACVSGYKCVAQGSYYSQCTPA